MRPFSSNFPSGDWERDVLIYPGFPGEWAISLNLGAAGELCSAGPCPHLQPTRALLGLQVRQGSSWRHCFAIRHLLLLSWESSWLSYCSPLWNKENECAKEQSAFAANPLWNQEDLHCLHSRRLSPAVSSENRPQPAFMSFVPGWHAVISSHSAPVLLYFVLGFMLDLWAEMLIVAENFD